MVVTRGKGSTLLKASRTTATTAAADRADTAGRADSDSLDVADSRDAVTSTPAWHRYLSTLIRMGYFEVRVVGRRQSDVSVV